MGRIFLSYARENRACAVNLAHVLEENGHVVWWDRHIDGGEDFAEEIEAELESADVVLVAWSKESIRSRWVRDEASVGGDTGRLVPVTIDGTRPPMGFRQFHTLDMAGWKGAARDPRTAELLHSVDRLTDKNSSVGRAAPPRGSEIGGVRHRRSAWIAAGAGALLTAAAVGYVVFKNDRDATGERPTLSILPFSATSSDAGLTSLASDARDSTAHALSDSGMSVRLVDSMPTGSAATGYVLVADFSGAPHLIVATVRLEEARHRETIWSRRIEIGRDEASVLPDRVGAQVAGSISWAAVLRTLRQGDALSVELQADLLRQLGGTGDPVRFYQTSQQLARKWPDVGLAQLGLGFYTGFALPEIPRDERPQAVMAARHAAARAKSLMPDFGDTYVPQCLLQPPTHFSQCEDDFRAGMRADPDAPFVNSFLAALLNGVGRTEESFAVARLSHLHDPYVPSKIALMIQMLAVTGDNADAYNLYKQAIGWWPDSGLQQGLFWGLIELGDFDGIVSLGERLGSADLNPGYAGILAIARAVKAGSISQLQHECGRKDGHWLEPAECMLAFAKLGNLDAAYQLADALYPDRLGRSTQQEQQIWLDNPDSMPLELVTSNGAAALRRDPRYLDLAQRTGLLRYWRSGRHPDFCVKHPEAICARLLRRS